MATETLADVINLIKNCPIIIADREKNANTRYRLGITVADQMAIIKSLSVADYYQGPMADHNGTVGNVWVFKKRALGEVFYIKIKYVVPPRAISCHIDEVI